MEKEERGSFDLFQPEILSREELIQKLKERCPTLDETSSLDHSALVELFYKHVAPHPQRKYRSNRRGSQMTKNQILREKRKRKHEEISGNLEQNQSPSSQPSSGLITSFNLKTTSYRLKPPPSAINFNRKVVKLGKPSTGSNITQESHKNTKIILSPSNTTKPNIMPQDKSPDANVTKDLSNIVINSKHQNGSDTAVTVEKNNTSSGITKILPEKKQVSSSKIKLKRTSDVNIESAMDVSSLLPKQAESEAGEHKEDMASNGMVTCENKSATSNRKISLTGRKESGEQEKNHSSQGSPTEVVQKKFKRVAITWP